MTRQAARMMASPFVRRRQADPGAPATHEGGVVAAAPGPAIRPTAAQLVAGAPAAAPAAVVQRVKIKDIAAKMKAKSHAPHGGSKNSNTHAAQHGHKQKGALRRMMGQIEAAEKKRAAAGTGKGKNK